MLVWPHYQNRLGHTKRCRIFFPKNRPTFTNACDSRYFSLGPQECFTKAKVISFDRVIIMFPFVKNYSINICLTICKLIIRFCFCFWDNINNSCSEEFYINYVYYFGVNQFCQDNFRTKHFPDSYVCS